MKKFFVLLTLLTTINARSRQDSGRPNAAIVIGGYIDTGGNPSSNDVTEKVELVGCESSPTASIEITSLPNRLAFSSGVYTSYDDESVLVCGGLECGSESCDPTNKCHNLVIGNTEWNTG